MSSQERFYRSRKAMVLFESNLERFLYNSNTNKSFLILVCRDLSVATAREGATFARLSFPQTLQPLDDFGFHPHWETLKMSLAYGPIDMSHSSPFLRMMQGIIIFKVELVTKMKLKTERSRAAEKAQMNMSATGLAADSNNPGMCPIATLRV